LNVDNIKCWVYTEDGKGEKNFLNDTK